MIFVIVVAPIALIVAAFAVSLAWQLSVSLVNKHGLPMVSLSFLLAVAFTGMLLYLIWAATSAT